MAKAILQAIVGITELLLFGAIGVGLVFTTLHAW